MPIRPDLRHLYRGPAWRETRARILERAGNACELCRAPNHVVVIRQYGWWTPPSLEASVWAMNGRFTHDDGDAMMPSGAVVETRGEYQFIRLPWKHAARDIGKPVENLVCFPNTAQHRWVRIVLTTAHLNHAPGDDRDENLLALCQWCHLRYDLTHHRETRSARKDAARPLLTTLASERMEA